MTICNLGNVQNSSKTIKQQTSLENPYYDLSASMNDNPQRQLALFPGVQQSVTSRPVMQHPMMSLPVMPRPVTSLPALPKDQNLNSYAQPLFYSDEAAQTRSAIVPSYTSDQELSSSNPVVIYGSSPVLTYSPVTFNPHIVPTYPAPAVAMPSTVEKKPAVVKQATSRKKDILWNRVPCVCILVIILSMLMVGGIVAVIVLVKCKLIRCRHFLNINFYKFHFKGALFPARKCITS